MNRSNIVSCSNNRTFLKEFLTLRLWQPKHANASAASSCNLQELMRSWFSYTDCHEWLPHLLISQATRPFTSMTSEDVANPRRRSTRFRHFSSSICSTVRAFFNSRFAALISPAIWRYAHAHTLLHRTYGNLATVKFQ